MRSTLTPRDVDPLFWGVLKPVFGFNRGSKADLLSRGCSSAADPSASAQAQYIPTGVAIDLTRGCCLRPGVKPRKE